MSVFIRQAVNWRVALLCSSLLLGACAGHGSANASPLSTASLPTIPEVRSAGGVATLALRASLDARRRPAFFWQGQEIAPTIRVRPGDEIHLHYENDLPEVCGLGLVSDSNLHFHGLSVAPIVHSDDVIATTVQPGKSFDYVIKIGADQPPGLYWYHPHPHGLANWEIGNGMSGAIVVEGIADEVPSLAGLREQVIVLRDIPLDSSVAAAEGPAASGPQGGPAPPPGDPDEAGPPCGIETTAQPTINGLPSATIGIGPGERQLWRVLNASAHRHYDLALISPSPHGPPSRMALAGQDGVPLGYYRNEAPLRTVAHVLIPPAGRADIVVTGLSTPQYLVSLCYNAGPKGDINPYAVLGELIDDHGTARTARVAPPAGLRESAAYRTMPPPKVRRTIAFEEDARGFYIDHAAYDPAKGPLITAYAGTTEEWTLENDTDEVHVFHIHQVHFVVESTNGRPEGTPRWLDVVDIPPQRHVHAARRPSTVKVLVDFRDPVVRGTFLFHCHIVDHEDGGMMAKIQVL